VDAAINVAQTNTIIKTNMSAFVEYDQKQSIANPFQIHRNTATMLPYGYDAMQLKAEQPTSTFSEFDDHLLREIARCLLLPRNAATGDSSDYNYASGRLDKQTYWRAVDIDRADMTRQVLNKVFYRWLTEAILIEGYLPESFRAIDSAFDIQWYFDGPLHVDPKKEADAKEIRLKIGDLSYQEMHAEQGNYWRDEFDKRKEAQDYAAKIGLSLNGETAEAQPAASPVPSDSDVTPVAKKELETEQEIETAPELTLNGAQIASAANIVSKVATGELPRDTGIGMLEILLNLTSEQAATVMGSAGIEPIEEGAANDEEQNANQAV
jgi:capsid protein